MKPYVFNQIKQEYDDFYKSLMKKGKLPLWGTEKGFWGGVIADEIYTAFKKIGLQNHKNFIDLGSGDGKVVLTAALFCERAIGIEIDNSLYNKSMEMQRKLNIPNAIFYNGDFNDHSISGYDYVFVYPDSPMHRGMEKKLLNELTGKVLHYGHHFHPENLNVEDKFVVNGNLFTVYTK
ncbi:MAG: class I SAM-dependent methyltransferase [archaeon]